MDEQINPDRIADLISVERGDPAVSGDGGEAGVGFSQRQVNELANILTFAVSAKTQIVDHQTVIAAKSDHIQKAQEHADAVRANLDRVLTSATQSATETEGLRTRAQSASDATATLLAELRASKGATDAEISAITASKRIAEEAADGAKKLADKADVIDQSLRAYEANITDLKQQYADVLAALEGLLPGAASAGLAHAFDVRRKTFLWPERIWQAIFVCCVVFLAAVAGTGFWHVYWSGVTPGYDELARLLLCRAPVFVIVGWLALHASREAALVKRLEEDYGYKAAVAASFVGFHKHVSQISTDDATGSAPLGTLCANTLATMATPPGRIYDKHPLAVSPAEELGKGAQALMAIEPQS